MSQVTGPLTIADGAAATKSFAPVRISPDDSMFAEKTAGVSAGFKTIAVSLDPANSNRPTNRVKLDLAIPVLSTVNGVSTVAYTLRANATFVIPDVANSTDRADLVAFFTNAVSNAQIKGVIKDLDPLY